MGASHQRLTSSKRGAKSRLKMSLSIGSQRIWNAISSRPKKAWHVGTAQVRDGGYHQKLGTRGALGKILVSSADSGSRMTGSLSTIRAPTQLFKDMHGFLQGDFVTLSSGRQVPEVLRTF